MKNLGLMFACFLMSSSLLSQVSLKPTDALPLDPTVRTGVLANGMKYYIKYNARPEKRAELRLAVNAGSTMENDDQQGLAHFVEHMAFNGSKNFKKNDLVNYLEGIGTKFGPDLNAYTSFDETVYMLQIPTDNQEIYKKGFLILEDWAHNLSFDSVEVEKERGVVMEEWRLGQGAFERMSRKYWPVMFKDSRYAERFPIGKPEILKNCKQSLLRDFYQQWYRPDLQAIIVVGDIDLDATEKLVKEQFSKIPASKNPKPIQSWQVPDQKDLRVSVVSDKESPYNVLQMMYFDKAKKIHSYDDYREHLKRELFNGMISARLNELTKKPNASILYAGAGYYGSVRNKDAYTSFALFPNGKVEEAILTVTLENERVKRYGFTSTEFERRKKQMLTEFEQNYNERDKTESKELVSEFVQLFLETEAAPGIDNEYQYVKTLLPTITLEEVNIQGQQWIRPNGENAMLVLMMTENEKNPIISDESAKTAFSKAEKQTSIGKYEDKVITTPFITSNPSPQRVFKTVDKGQGITEWTLGNGARILLKPTNFKADEVLFSAHSWGGTNLYSDKDYRSADASNAVQEQMGFGKFDATALEKYLQDKTASLYAGVGPYNEVLNGRSSKKDIETLLQLVYADFTMARKDSSAFVAWIQQQKGFIQNASADPGKIFGDSVNYIMSGYHPRAKPETEQTVSEVDLDRTFQIYKERFLDPSDFVFTMVGNFSLDSLKPLVEKYIGGISAPIKHEARKDLQMKAPKGNLTKTFYKGHEPRTSVRLMWNGESPYSRKNRFEARALTNLLNITLRENLREDKGGVYGVGIYAQLEDFPKGTYKITCQFSCAPDNTEKLIAAAKEEIENAKKNGCNEINLGKIKETLLKEREVQLKENNFWLGYISSADIYNEQLSDIDQYNNWVNALKSDDFKRLANLYFNESSFKRFVLNPEK
ncbi:peptidase M16 [Sphingobacteriaceae bacterium]|nr:peptidase M16 [Sphingobacteriaceae bacterium]